MSNAERSGFPTSAGILLGLGLGGLFHASTRRSDL